MVINLREEIEKEKVQKAGSPIFYHFCKNFPTLHEKIKIRMAFPLLDNIKDDNVTQEIDDETLFELKSEKLAKALHLIDPADKMILLMKYQDDMSIKEIMGVLKVGESAVKMRIKRAKQKVVRTYEEL